MPNASNTTFWLHSLQCCHATRSCSATKSYAMSQCLPKFLNSTADLVFMEFVANDGSERDTTLLSNDKTRAYERFMRKILSQPKAPAVVQVQVRCKGMTSVFAVVDGWNLVYLMCRRLVFGSMELLWASLLLLGSSGGKREQTTAHQRERARYSVCFGRKIVSQPKAPAVVQVRTQQLAVFPVHQRL